MNSIVFTACMGKCDDSRFLSATLEPQSLEIHSLFSVVNRMLMTFYKTPLFKQTHKRKNRYVNTIGSIEFHK